MQQSILSEKQIEILKVIDSHGVITKNQISDRVTLTDKRIGVALQKLEKLGFIRVYKITRKYCYYITKKGSEYIGLLSFGYVKNEKEPNLALLRHSLLVNDSILEDVREAKEKVPNAIITVVTEREWLAENFLMLDGMVLSSKQAHKEKMQARNRVPDYILKIPISAETTLNNAHEVELSRKGKVALHRKLAWYLHNQELGLISHVTYIYEDQAVRRHVARVAQQVGIKIFFRKLGEIDE